MQQDQPKISKNIVQWNQQFPQKSRALQDLANQVVFKYLEGVQCDEDLLQRLRSHLNPKHNNALIDIEMQNAQNGANGQQSFSQLGQISLEGLLEQHVEKLQSSNIKSRIRHYLQKMSNLKPFEVPNCQSHILQTSNGPKRMQELIKGLNRGIPFGWGRRQVQESQNVITAYCTFLKTCFGHALHAQNSQDPEDPYIHVYNLIYDRYGQLIITGDDMGLIKIWSASNGLLLNSLKGHTMAINAIEVNHSNDYLASCSNDGLVLVWELATGRPITALKESNDDPILVLLFYRGRNEEFLITASEKGNTYVYRLHDIIKCQGGILGTQFNCKFQTTGITHKATITKLFQKQRPHFVKDKLVDTLNGILSIDMHPKGYFAAGTEVGDVIVYEALEKIIQQNLSGQNSYLVWKEHNDNCHMLKWNKQGTKLITASFDGTAKIWDWAAVFQQNRETRSAVTLHYSERDHSSKLSGELKCWAVAWSCKGTYAIGSFCRKLRRRGDNEKSFPQLQIYDCIRGELVHTIDQSNLNSSIKFDTPHCLVDAHPHLEAVVMSADNDGLIVVWDIKRGLILRVFFEKGFHMRLPNLEMQILEGGWAPDGYTFSVTTAYGSFSIYGYSHSEFYKQVPVEQFFASDSEHALIDDTYGFKVLALDQDQEFYLLDRGSICNFYRLPYTYQLPKNFKILMSNNFYKNQELPLQKKKTGKSSVTKSFQYIYWNYSVQIEQENARNDLMFYNNYKELQEIENDIYLKQKEQQDILYAQQISDLTLKADQYLDMIQNNFPIKGSDQKQQSVPRTSSQKKGRLQQQIPQLKVRDGDMEFEIYQPIESAGHSESHSPKVNAQRSKRRRVIDDEEDQLDDLEVYGLNSSAENRVQTRGAQRQQSREERLMNRRLRQVEIEDQESDNQSDQSLEQFVEHRQSQPRTRQRAMASQMPSQEQRLSRLNQHRQQQQQVQQEEPQVRKQRRQNHSYDVCKRCKQQLSGEITSCTTCRQKYHEYCGQIRLLQDEYGSTRKCFNCLAKVFVRKGQHKYSQIPRDYLIDNIWLPQLNDKMIFFTLGYEQFLNTFHTQVDLSKLLQVNDRFIVFPGDFEHMDASNIGQIEVNVDDISYEFPIITQKKYDPSKFHIYMLLTLSWESHQFKVYYNGQNPNYLVHENLYSKGQSIRLNPNVLLTYGDQQYLYLGTENFDQYLINNLWQTVKCRGIQDDQYALRGTKSNQNSVRLNCWEIDTIGGRQAVNVQFEEFDSTLCKKLSKDILNFTKKHFGYRTYFLDPVDTVKYIDYYDYVQFKMDVKTISDRLSSGYYRSKEQIQFDINLIRENASKYNPPDSEVANLAYDLSQSLTDMLEVFEDPLKDTSIQLEKKEKSSEKMQLRQRSQKQKVQYYSPDEQEENENSFENNYEIETRGRLRRG